MNQDLQALLQEAGTLPDGAAKLEVLEAAVRIADAEGELELAYDTRSDIVRTAIFNGFPLKAVVAFSWQLGQYDRHPELFDSYDLLWSYKWIVGEIAHFPDIPLQQIAALVEDLGKRYEAHGYSSRTYLYYRFRLAMDLGNMQEAETFMERFRQARRDYMSDCDACEQNQIVQYYAAAGDDLKALEAAKPILAGSMRCAEVPHITLAHLLLPLHRARSAEEAAKAHTRGYRLIKGKRDFIEAIARHIDYLAVTNPKKGIELFEQHVALTQQHEDPYQTMLFRLYSSKLLHRVAADGLKYQPRLPASFLAEHGEMDLEALARHLGRQATSAAEKYDLRNGNTIYSELAAAALSE
ncbi:hypothetical protein N0M98_25680 [Paenibacillus doosanensis]|uniref:Uncharacterized protein n=1 Tax=Paenibacillus konkukensis TaxID=2020716 RepID=A0ABY4RPU2_9BACL|nr:MULTISPECIES: hypothetical protein [Paenibacillus]MCS7463502.1 hypothetical protein [Paenibacillus doosanensis]UQZ83414.1 hypothetical protein SK3146_02601 [Paenibacillus konkukensis]